MDYLCLAFQREVARSERGSREQAQEYFLEKFGNRERAKLEKERKKLEGRICYYVRKAEKHKGEPELEAECFRRREDAQRELEYVESQLEGRQELFQVWAYEGICESCFETSDGFVLGESFLMLNMARICRVGGNFQVVEETYSYRMWKEAGDRGIAEVRNRIPEDATGSCISLDICQEKPETAQRFRMKIKKMRAEARRKFRAAEKAAAL